MSSFLDPALLALNDCGCCEGVSAETPARLWNRPGLPAIAYRVGAHAQFLETMLARLSSEEWAKLRDLNTRDTDDFTIAFLDSWAVVADILTFYQERIANESYLGTALEGLSLRELGRLIGYKPRPGVAASAYLAFTLDEKDVKGQPYRLTLPAGMKAQSVPDPGEQAQTFESIESIAARSEWNALRPRLRQNQSLSAAMESVTLQSIGNNLRAGDPLLIVTGGTRTLKRALAVTLDAPAQTTRVDFVAAPQPVSFARPEGLPQGAVFTAPTSLTESVIQAEILGKTWNAEDLTALATAQGWNLDMLEKAVNDALAEPPGDSGLYALRQRAAIFGHNAPVYATLPAVLRFGEKVKDKNDADVVVEPAYPTTWEGKTLAGDIGNGTRQVYLDNAYPGILPDSYLALERPADPTDAARPAFQHVYQVQAVAETTRADFAVSAKTTVATLDSNADFGQFRLRETNALAQSEPLPLATLPIEDAVSGDALTLDRACFGLQAGQQILLTGERADLPGVTASERREIFQVLLEGGYTVLLLTAALTYSYVRASVTINANVALATHGETIPTPEILGSGDATQGFPKFPLKQPPLTYISAPTPTGGQTTLEVRVNDLLWAEVPTLYARGPEERIYTVQTGEAGAATVVFGDGKAGARLPTGAANVSAVYRKGIGKAGNVKARQLSLLMSRPLGLKEVVNPEAATGGEDPEGADQLRRNAPLAILTLDRVVSVQDYEDFAQAFGGVGKARATWTWDGQQRGIAVTVAGVDGADVPAGSPLFENLLTALRAAGDPYVPLALLPYANATFRLAGTVQSDPAYRQEAVLAAVEAMLRDRFSFANRAFGQPVHRSEVVAAIQNVPGVVAVTLAALHRAELPVTLESRLLAALPQAGAGAVAPAELLRLDSGPLGLEVAT